MEWQGEKKYNIRSIGSDHLKHLEKIGVDTSHATMYMPASFGLIEKCIQYCKPQAIKHLLDVGCGMGRVVVVAAHLGVLNITGIELSKKLLEVARKNINRSGASIKADIQIKHADAYYYEIEKNVDVIFLFNPFDGFVMQKLIQNIEESLLQQPRTMHIIYLNPMEKELFTRNGYHEVFAETQYTYLEACILTKSQL